MNALYSTTSYALSPFLCITQHPLRGWMCWRRAMADTQTCHNREIRFYGVFPVHNGRQHYTAMRQHGGLCAHRRGRMNWRMVYTLYTIQCLDVYNDWMEARDTWWMDTTKTTQKSPYHERSEVYRECPY